MAKTSEETNYINFYDYYISKYNTTYKTIHVKTEVSDGQEFKYLTTKEIQLNSDYKAMATNEKLLIETDKIIFDRKYQNSYIHIYEIGEGSFGKVNKVKEKITGDLFAIKIMKIDSK